MSVRLSTVTSWIVVVIDCCVHQAQYGYIVVQMLMSHLDENSRKEAQIKVSIIDVLSVTVLIAAGGSIGLFLNGSFYLNSFVNSVTLK